MTDAQDEALNEANTVRDRLNTKRIWDMHRHFLLERTSDDPLYHASMWIMLLCDEIDKLRAALSAMDTPKGGGDGWQSIETAPRDADSVMIFIPGKGRYAVKQGFWDRDHWRWFGCRSITEGRRNQPTHWMPLPPAPPAAMKDGG